MLKPMDAAGTLFWGRIGVAALGRRDAAGIEERSFVAKGAPPLVPRPAWSK